MCHESSGVALDADDRRRQGHGVSSTTSTQADAHPRHRSEPRHQPPAHADRRCEAAARRGCQIVAINPLPEAGLSRFAHPQQPAGRARAAARRSPACTCRCGSAATSRSSRASMKELLERGRAAPRRTSLDHAFIDRHTDGFDERLPSALAAEPWDAAGRRERRRPRARCARWRDLHGGHAPDHRLLGDGAHAAQARGREHPGDRQPAAAARQRRPAGRGRSARCAATATCRATARWASTTRPGAAFLDALGATVRLRAAARARATTPSARSGRCATGRVDVLLRAGRQLPVGGARHRRDRAARCARCALTAHVSTKLNRAHLVTGPRGAASCPASAAPSATSRPAGPQFVTVEDSMSIVHASRGRAAAGRRRTCGARSRSSPAWPQARARRADARATGQGWRRTTTASATHIERVVPGFEDVNARVRDAGGFVLPNAGARARASRPPAGRARFTVHRRARDRRSRRGSCC